MAKERRQRSWKQEVIHTRGWDVDRENEVGIRRGCRGTSLVVQCLRLWAANAGGPGSIAGQETNSYMQQQKIPHAATKTQGSQINECFFKNKKKRLERGCRVEIVRRFGLGNVHRVNLSLNSDGKLFKSFKLELGIMKDWDLSLSNDSQPGSHIRKTLGETFKNKHLQIPPYIKWIRISRGVSQRSVIFYKVKEQCFKLSQTPHSYIAL